MLHRFVFFLLISCLSFSIFGQANEGSKSTKISAYDIKVSLDTTNHTLKGSEIITYQNSSGIELTQIYIHLWANAYRSNSTELITQQLMIGKTDMYFFNDNDRGGYTDLTLKSKSGVSYSTSYQDETEEILIVDLSKPLLPGAAIEFYIDFEIKIPKLSSRFGHISNYYQLAHWYPRVAKCDNGLWHAMPYLEIGEYFHDFANYDVTINLPEGFQESATGLLESEIGNTKRYLANQVTDFAWFASDDFTIDKKKVEIEGIEISLELVKHNNYSTWDNSMDYLERSLEFLSHEIGSYPFPAAKVVISKYGGKSGMEYPMITIIGETEDAERLDHLIVHELAHNWFYGALSSNERRYPWLDEGITTFYDHKYHNQYYQADPYENELPELLKGDSPYSILRAGVQAQSDLGKLQASHLHSDEFSALNYGVSVYERPAMGFRFLENYLGEDVFSRCVKKYYQEFKFSNPNPDNMKSVFESISKKDLSWFFDAYISTNRGPDYAIKSITGNSIKIENTSNCKAPFAIRSNVDNEEHIIWFDGFLGISEVDIPIDFQSNASLDVSQNLLDINPWNNNPKRPIKFKFISGLDNPDRRQINFSPYFGYNSHDNLYACLALSNSSFPNKRFRWFLAPGYSFSGKDPGLVGIGSMQYDIKRYGEFFRKIIGGISARRFNFFSSESYGLHYEKVKPFLRFYIKSDPKDRTTKYFEINSHIIFEEEAIFQEEDIFFENRSRIAEQFKYNFWYQDPIASIKWETTLEMQQYKKFDDSNASYMKLSSSYLYKYQFAKGRFLDFRLFGAYFLRNTERESSAYANSLARGSISLTPQGFTDNLYEEFYFGRNLQSGFFSNQVNSGEGDFKNALGSSYKVGLSNSYAFAFNFKIDSPLLFAPYLDVGYYASKSSTESEFQNKTLYSIGLALEFIDDAIGIYVPLFNSAEINDVYRSQSFFSRITFKFDFNRLDLWKASEDYSF